MSGYQTFCAKDGIEGLSMAQKLIPDLIICDVMMPNMDGFECLQKLKETRELELIPVFMLTARVEIEAKLKGLELGADDYITKPFEFKELSLKLSNKINNRKKLIESLTDKKPIFSQDHIFLKKLNLIIDENIHNSKFKVADLANLLNMSISTLNRHVKQTTDKSPNQLINEYRMNLAKKMIQNNHGTLSEIAYKVGFSSISYFSFAYKEHYGISPSDEPQKTVD